MGLPPRPGERCTSLEPTQREYCTNNKKPGVERRADPPNLRAMFRGL